MINTATYDATIYFDPSTGSIDLLVWRILPVGTDGCEFRDP